MIILITGASGSLGSALAKRFAQPGSKLVLQGRNEATLSKLADQCRSLGAEVQVDIFDLSCDEDRLTWLNALIYSCLPDMVFINAGMNAHAEPGEKLESWAKTAALLDLNVKATIHLAQALGNAMQLRGSGQLILISSLAAWFGLSVSPAYSASKAAVKVYGEALRAALESTGVQVTVVLPGYFKSPMCEAMPGPKPWVWSADRAANFIIKRLKNNPPRIGFPFLLYFGCWWLAVLPARISQRFVKWLGYQL